ncbi:MAG: hypothetical protein ACREU8_01510, partial [Gammaproteobacteria bacterium]
DILELKEIAPDQLLGDSGSSQIFFSYSPVRFADKFGENLSKSSSIFLLFANLTEIETNGYAVTIVSQTH